MHVVLIGYNSDYRGDLRVVTPKIPQIYSLSTMCISSLLCLLLHFLSPFEIPGCPSTSALRCFSLGIASCLTGNVICWYLGHLLIDCWRTSHLAFEEKSCVQKSALNWQLNLDYYCTFLGQNYRLSLAWLCSQRRWQKGSHWKWACAVVHVFMGGKWQGRERVYYFCREAGRQTPYSSLLISSRWPTFEALCLSPPLSIALHSWDGKHGDHSWVSSPTGQREDLGGRLEVRCSPCAGTWY